MSAIKRQPNDANDTSSRKSLLTIGGIILIVAALLFAYLMWHVSPEEYVERVDAIANNEAGCIAETFDGYAVNIVECIVQQGEYVNAVIDGKLKERAAAMNPTS